MLDSKSVRAIACYSCFFFGDLWDNEFFKPKIKVIWPAEKKKKSPPGGDPDGRGDQIWQSLGIHRGAGAYSTNLPH